MDTPSACTQLGFWGRDYLLLRLRLQKRQLQPSEPLRCRRPHDAIHLHCCMLDEFKSLGHCWNSKEVGKKGWVGLRVVGWAGLGWAGLGWVGLGWVGLGNDAIKNGGVVLGG